MKSYFPNCEGCKNHACRPLPVADNGKSILKTLFNAIFLIIEQSSVIVPFAVNFTLFCVFDKFFQTAFEKLGLLFFDLYCVYPDPPVKRRECGKIFPYGFVGLQCV